MTQENQVIPYAKVSSLLPTNTICLSKVIVYVTMSNYVKFTPLNNAFNFVGFIQSLVYYIGLYMLEILQSGG